jgi:D-3-phosphoglycerate dehydrogenase / 2-oxoglutarate reductase
MLAVDRHIPAGTADLKQGNWNKGRYSAASGLAGRTLGILGMGGIGQAVTARAHSFDMKVIAWSRSLTEAQAESMGVTRANTPRDVALAADILTVHLALTDDTRGLVDTTLLAALGDDGLLINTSRAPVVDSNALMAALDRGLRAGLDVFPDEPSTKVGAIDSPLARHPNVVGTHHIGASTQQAQDAVAHAVADIVDRYANTGDVPNCVNLARQTLAEHMLVVRHEDQVGVLAAVLDGLRKRNINVQEMENRIFAGGRAAVARIQISGDVPTDLLAGLKGHAHILNISLVRLQTEQP